ncbi:unnamed protein product [Mytilus coruscus]|uniref:Death domain-containing protein n=1 Tax=Mytilus coruscus TaxID=42192 RepID=A0A6J8BM25_MYTCO|nr:unnamed protein product [Mytilus coruscus]
MALAGSIESKQELDEENKSPRNADGKEHTDNISELLQKEADPNLDGISERLDLRNADEKGHTNEVSEIIQREVDPILDDISENKAPRNADEKEHTDNVSELRQREADQHLGGMSERLDLRNADEKGHTNEVSEIIHRKVDPILDDTSENKAPRNADQKEHTDNVSELRQREADQHLGGMSERLDLRNADEKGHTNEVSEIIHREVDPILDDTSENKAPRNADQKEHTDNVSELRQREADQHLGGMSESKALINAAIKGDTDKVSELLQRGADPNLADLCGKTAIHYAAQYGHVDIISKLLNEGTVSIQFQRTAIHSAAGYGQKHIVSKLLDEGADANFLDEFGKTPLHYAAEYGHTQIVSELLQRGANLNLDDAFGHRPLHYAIISNQNDILDELLNRGSDPDVVDQYGLTPLHCAAEMNKSKDIVVEFLLRGADHTIVDKDGRTALHHAAMKGSWDIVSELINRGSDLSLLDKDRESPIQYAARYQKYIFGGNTNRRNYPKMEPTISGLKSFLQKCITYRTIISGEYLKETLRGLGLENVVDLQELFQEKYQKCFWNRVYLVGPYSVGKSCLAKILVGEPVSTIRQSTDGIWIYMGKAGMNIEKMEWVFFPKGNAITEVLTNMLMSMSSGEKESNVEDSVHDINLDDKTPTVESAKVKFKERADTFQISENTKGATVDDVDTGETSYNMKEQQLPENRSSNVKMADNIHDNTSLDNQKHIDASQVEKDKEKTQRVIVASDNLECEWMKEITINMSPDKIHELIVKAVQEGKYRQMVVPIDIWDFGGQKDYYMTHQLFITSRGIFVLMFNGSIALHKHMPDLTFLPGHFGKPTVAVYLLHWVNSILTYCKRTDGGFPRIIFVATHKDEKWFQWTQEARRKQLENELQQLFENHGGLEHLEFKPLIFVDATNPDDSEIADLRERIMQRATEHPRWGEAMPTRWIPLELQLAQKSSEGINIISRDQLLVLNSKNESMILSERQLATFLKVQHSLGKLLYFDVENLRDFIILSPAYLVEVLRSIVTEKQFWPTGERFFKILKSLQETGMIERVDIYYLWEQDNFKHILSYKEYMIQILVHLDVLIAPKTSFEELNSPIQDASNFLVPCMITKENDTMFLQKFRHSNNSIVIAYTFIEEVIPPALSYRFLSSLIASWDIKIYRGKYREKRMLFSNLAVVKIDSFHDVAVQVKTNKIIVSLIHAKTKEDIIPTLASSLQECLTATIVGISKFYSKLSEGVPSADEKSAIPFNIEFGVFCKSDICFFNHNDMSLSTGEPIWICKKHKQRHKIKNPQCLPNLDVCKSSCKGLGRLEKERCPLPHHIRRLAAQLSTAECREIAIMLGSTTQEWDDLVYEFQRQPTNDLKLMALWSCIMKSVNFSFDSLQNVLENKGRSAHLLCELFRDVMIDVSDMSEDTLNKIPSVDALHELSNHIGNSNMQLAIELEVDLSYIQQIQYDHKNKLLDQTRKMFLKWRHNKYPKPTVLRLLKASSRVGKFGPTYKVLKNYL